MYKVVFDVRALLGVDQYIEQYTKYYEHLYSDSGIWSEDQIIEQYRLEWYARYDEIIDTITMTLQTDVVSYMQDKTLIRWRTKVILLSFQDIWDLRRVIEIEIR